MIRNPLRSLPRSSRPLESEIISGGVAHRRAIYGVKAAAAPGGEQQMMIVGKVILAAEIETRRSTSAIHICGLVKHFATEH